MTDKHKGLGIGDQEQLIEEHYAKFDEIVSLAKVTLRENNFEASAGYVQIAACYAWFHPTGLFSSRELEDLLIQIGSRVAAKCSNPKRSFAESPKDVIHVFTEAYKLGGHTRLAWRWIESDVARSHSVVFTSQGHLEVPTPLKTAVAASGGKLHFLDRYPGGVLTRALALRRLAESADHVVLHIHPHDVIPLIAFAQKEGRPPLTFLNHNDHVFWLGAFFVDQVAQMRDSGLRLSQARRGIAEACCTYLPIPLGPEPLPYSRAEAKKQLGIPEEAVVLLSVATPYKYSSICEKHFTDLLQPILNKHREALLIVVGPKEEGKWALAASRSEGRLKVVGKVEGVERYYRAADVYVDSFPFSSLTSLLEAGIHGAPIVSYCVYPDEAEILCADDLALTGLLVKTRDTDEYESNISRLIENPEWRADLGARTRHSIVATHCEPSWKHFVEDLYLGGVDRYSHTNSSRVDALRQITELDKLLMKVFAASGLSREFGAIVRDNIGLFPLRERLKIWKEILGYEWRFLPGSILADWQKARIKSLFSS